MFVSCFFARIPAGDLAYEQSVLCSPHSQPSGVILGRGPYATHSFRPRSVRALGAYKLYTQTRDSNPPLSLSLFRIGASPARDVYTRI